MQPYVPKSIRYENSFKINCTCPLPLDLLKSLASNAYECNYTSPFKAYLTDYRMVQGHWDI